MKNRLLQLVAGLALMAVLGKFYAVPLIAQVRAALVKSIDEPGRTPYQSDASCQPTPVTEFCGMEMTPVPAGKRLVVKHVNVLFQCSNACSVDFLRVFDMVHGQLSDPNAWLTPPPSFSVTSHMAGVNQDVLFYVEPGGVPEVAFNFNDFISGSARGAISGYLVDLNQ